MEEFVVTARLRLTKWAKRAGCVVFLAAGGVNGE